MRPSTRQDWLAAGALLLGLAATFAIPPATTGTSAARAVAAMAISALLALAVARAPFTFAPRIRPAFVLLVLLALWYVATRAWAVDPAGSMVESSRVSAFVLMAWASHTAVVGTGARRLLLGGVAACALFVALPPFWDFLQNGTPTERIPGELGYWNASAIVALTLVPCAVALAGSGRRRLIAVAVVLLPIAAVNGVANASRGALVALLAGLLLQAVLDPDYRGSLSRGLTAGAAVGLMVAGLTVDGVPDIIALLAPMIGAGAAFGVIRARRRAADAYLVAVKVHDEKALSRRFQPVRLAGAFLVVCLVVLLGALVVDAGDSSMPDRGVEAEASSTRLASTDDSLRTEWWRIGFDIWKAAPIIGAGGGAFAAESTGPSGATPTHVHSMPLEVALETGLIGFVLLVAASIQLMRVLRHGRRSVERALAGAVAAMLIAQGLIDWTLSFPQVLALLAITGVLSLQRPPDPEEVPVSAPPLVPALAMLVSLAAATLVAFAPVLASLLAEQGTEKFDAGKPGQAAPLFEQSALLVPSMETLTLQVISLEMAGREDEARDVLREREQVWSTRMDGLLLAQELLGDDRELGPLIERRMDQIASGRPVRDLT